MTSDDASNEPSAPGPGDPGGGPDRGRFAVLEVFGLKLEVSNPRVAELLTMEAKDALTTDVRELGQSSSEPVSTAEMAQAIPDTVITPVTPHDDEDARVRHQFRSRVQAVGQALGFDTRPDGVWTSPTGVAILTRSVDKPVSLAASSHFVGEIAARREDLAGSDSTALFVVESQQTADVFKVAIRQRRLYDVMRTVSIGNLERILALLGTGEIDHAKAVVLLVPMANIDVGEVLSVIHASDDEDS